MDGGGFIALCVVERDSSGSVDYTILEPKAVKQKWSSTYHRLTITPAGMTYVIRSKFHVRCELD